MSDDGWIRSTAGSTRASAGSADSLDGADGRGSRKINPKLVESIEFLTVCRGSDTDDYTIL